jgi:hypothetical protein
VKDRHIRPATERDLEGVVALYLRAFPARAREQVDERTRHLRSVLFEHPWRGEGAHSLAYDEGGELVGFLGVLPRPMTFRGRPALMAVSHHFMVDPARRGSLAGVSLMKEFLSGPQDLSLCEPQSEIVRKIWTGLRGTTDLLRGMVWTCWLRPARHAARALRLRGMPRPLAGLLGLAARPFDAAAASLSSSPFRIQAPPAPPEPLAPEALPDLLQELSADCALRPVYTSASMAWLVGLIAGQGQRGELRMSRVRGTGGESLGYYVWLARPDGTADLLQAAARKGAWPEVLRAVTFEAWKWGATALSGRMDPRYVEHMPDAARFQAGNRFLVHARDEELRRALQGPDLFLTRLESEWWIPFQPREG